MSRPLTATASSPTRARVGVSLMFFTNGVLFSALLPRYPELKASFGLTNSEFGLLVVAFPAGALLAAAFAGRVLRKLGTTRTSAAGSLALAAAIIVAGTGQTPWLFAGALLAAGAVDAVVDAAQNVQGVLVEQWRGRSLINSFHAVWSAGAATGGAIGAAAAAADVPPAVQVTVNGAVWAAVAVLAARLSAVPAEVRAQALSEELRPPGARTSPGPRAWRLLLPLVVLAVCGTLVEDVANNWVVLYLRTSTNAPAVVAGLGLSAVLAAQFAGRLIGDPMTDRWGRAAVARAGGVLIASGATLAVVATAYPVTLAGFALTGFGCATLVPAAFAAAGRIPGLREGTGIAVLGWLMRLGFLLTSPAVGRLSDLTSLRTALLIPAGAGVVAAVLAHGQRPPRPRPGAVAGADDGASSPSGHPYEPDLSTAGRAGHDRD